jgi:hypothetical protein
MIPAWAMMGLTAGAMLILRMVQAVTDADREEALMKAAEDIKAALDAKKFGGG